MNRATVVLLALGVGCSDGGGSAEVDARGDPLASPHEDAAHGAHCTSDRCAMYW